MRLYTTGIKWWKIWKTHITNKRTWLLWSPGIQRNSGPTQANLSLPANFWVGFCGSSNSYRWHGDSIPWHPASRDESPIRTPPFWQQIFCWMMLKVVHQNTTAVSNSSRPRSWGCWSLFELWHPRPPSLEFWHVPREKRVKSALVDPTARSAWCEPFAGTTLMSYRSLDENPWDLPSGNLR